MGSIHIQDQIYIYGCILYIPTCTQTYHSQTTSACKLLTQCSNSSRIQVHAPDMMKQHVLPNVANHDTDTDMHSAYDKVMQHVTHGCYL